MSDRWARVFDWIWRVNGLILLVLGALALAGALMLVTEMAGFASRDRPEEHLTQVAGTDLSTGDLRLDDFDEVTGTRYLHAELSARQEHIASGGSRDVGFAHNILFFDTRTKQAHWLLAENDQTLPSVSFVVDGSERQRTALALLVEIQPQQGSRRLSIASPGGEGLTPIAESTDALLGYHLVDKGSLLVFYVSGGVARVVDLDPVARSVRSDSVLSAGR